MIRHNMATSEWFRDQIHQYSIFFFATSLKSKSYVIGSQVDLYLDDRNDPYATIRIIALTLKFARDFGDSDISACRLDPDSAAEFLAGKSPDSKICIYTFEITSVKEHK